MVKELKSALTLLRQAATESEPVAGLTHNFYRYPARFSPTFARAAIRLFSEKHDTILDPFMGGATAIVEALANGRNAIGMDINPLSVFLARVKTTLLFSAEAETVRGWAKDVRHVSYHSDENLECVLCEERTRNLTDPQARVIKKLLALALSNLQNLPTRESRNFCRCVLLRVGQWALDGRKTLPRAEEFRRQLEHSCLEMLNAIHDLTCLSAPMRRLVLGSPSDLLTSGSFDDLPRADLVVTSPPYPGVHVLYHRWQVRGRLETPAPYWLCDCQDGRGASYYTFGDRRRVDDLYFEKAAECFRGIHQLVKTGGLVIQMVGFSKPETQFPRYLKTLEEAGFCELPEFSSTIRRIKRSVPRRKWHATAKGRLPSSTEIVLLHRAR